MCTPCNVQFFTYLYPSLSWPCLAEDWRTCRVESSCFHFVPIHSSPSRKQYQHMGRDKGWTMGWGDKVARPLLPLVCSENLAHCICDVYERLSLTCFVLPTEGGIVGMGRQTCLRIAHDKLVKHVCINSRNSAWYFPLSSLQTSLYCSCSCL